VPAASADRVPATSCVSLRACLDRTGSARRANQAIFRVRHPSLGVGPGILSESFERPGRDRLIDQLQLVNECKSNQLVLRVGWSRHSSAGTGSADVRQSITTALRQSGLSRVPGQRSHGPHHSRTLTALVLSGPIILIQSEQAYLQVVTSRHQDQELLSQCKSKARLRCNSGHDDSSYQHTPLAGSLSVSPCTMIR